MTKGQALNKFFNSFGMDAYEVNSVPSDVKLPYLTYEYASDDFGSDAINIQVQLWFKTYSEATPNKKVEEIGKVIGIGGVMIPCDGGAIWIKRGTPWCNATSLQDDNSVKLRILNVDLEFLTI